MPVQQLLGRAVDGSRNVQASILYAPYGSPRYANGTMPTDYGFTGQRADAMTGLDYYGARYYDPAAGQFTSADAVASAPNRYAYVDDNPTTLTDPTGQSTKKKHSSTTRKAATAAKAKTKAAKTKAVAGLPGCAVQLTCSLAQFDAMTTAQRKLWLQWLDDTYGKNWFSRVDAAILQGIQDGLALKLGIIKSSDNPAGVLWKAFFDARGRSADALGRTAQIASITISRMLWGQAEQEATRHGVAVADQAVHAHEIEDSPAYVRNAFIGLGDQFRSLVAGGSLDPSNYWQTYLMVQAAITAALFFTGGNPFSATNFHG